MSTAAAQIDDAVALFEDFHGFKPGPRQIGAIVQDGRAAGLQIGKIHSITYQPLKDKDRYKHDFLPEARPDLAVSYDGKQSYIVGGDYDFTDRGFVDRVTKGNPKMAGSILFMNPHSKTKGKTMAKAKRKHGGQFKKKHHGKTRRNPRSYSRARRALSNPRDGGLSLSSGSIMGMVMPAAIGAAGAVGVDMLWNQFAANIPASLQSGVPMRLAQGALAVGAGIVVGMVAGKRTGALVAAGGVTVAAYNLITDLMAQSGTGADPATGDPSGNLQRYIAARRGMNRYVAGPARRPGMAYVNPGRIVA